MACLSDQAKISLLQESIKREKAKIRNAFILGLAGIVFASVGFFSYGAGLSGLSFAWLALGVAGSAIVIAAFYVMIRADRRVEEWKRQLGEVASPTIKPLDSDAEHTTTDDDKYFDENHEQWKNPFEEEKQ